MNDAKTNLDKQIDGVEVGLEPDALGSVVSLCLDDLADGAGGECDEADGRRRREGTSHADDRRIRRSLEMTQHAVGHLRQVAARLDEKIHRVICQGMDVGMNI